MTRLQRFAALTDAHFAMVESIRDLEAEWGAGAPIGRLAQRVGGSEIEAEIMLDDLAAVGLVLWLPAERVAYHEPGALILGEVA